MWQVAVRAENLISKKEEEKVTEVFPKFTKCRFENGLSTKSAGGTPVQEAGGQFQIVTHGGSGCF